MTKILEFFGHDTRADEIDWMQIADAQYCPFLNRNCLKTRKSDPTTAIGSCSVNYGAKNPKPIVICPHRLLARRQLFVDSLHLLSLHEPGNQLHIVAEVPLPGGSIDFFLVSTRGSRVKDFVGIELQSLDTTGTVWPERQRFLDSQGIAFDRESAESDKSFGMNWKMTAKTTLIQLHHKIETFENVNKHLVLVLQDYLLEYIQREFQFGQLNNGLIGDSMHFHAYRMTQNEVGQGYGLELSSRTSTDAAGIARGLGLQADANLELQAIVDILENRLSEQTLFTLV